MRAARAEGWHDLAHRQRQCIVAASDVWQHDRGVQSLAGGTLAAGLDPQPSQENGARPVVENSRECLFESHLRKTYTGPSSVIAR